MMDVEAHLSSTKMTRLWCLSLPIFNVSALPNGATHDETWLRQDDFFDNWDSQVIFSEWEGWRDDYDWFLSTRIY